MFRDSRIYPQEVSYIFATRCRRTMISLGLKNYKLKYQRFTPLGCKYYKDKKIWVCGKNSIPLKEIGYRDWAFKKTSQKYCYFSWHIATLIEYDICLFLLCYSDYGSSAL